MLYFNLDTTITLLLVTGVGSRNIKNCALTASVFLQDSQFQSNTIWHILDVVVAVQRLRHTIVHI